MTENLFSYGTTGIRPAEHFSSLIERPQGSILGYSLSYIEIVDKEVIAKSGQTHHPIIQYSGKAEDEVEGTVFNVTKEELLQADEYEVDDYKRVTVPLKSGGFTWVYVAIDRHHRNFKSTIANTIRALNSLTNKNPSAYKV
ncbi:MAG TPA: gamma-glutamylcyclotransferase family protein [Chryseolinea sp.]